MAGISKPHIAAESVTATDMLIQGELYKPGYTVPNRKYGELAFRIAIVSILAFPTLLLLSIIYVFVKGFMREPGPFLYQGQRLGQFKRPFTIYKIRTLKLDAESVIGGSLFRPDSNMAIRGGHFLRYTRLDELPQLYNILKGDMYLVGPRPMRQAEYDTVAKTIPNYDARFRVKPGLTGIAQLITPHKTPKRMRSFIENRYYASAKSAGEQLKWVLVTILVVLKLIIVEGCSTLVNRCRCMLRGHISDARKMVRRHPRKHYVRINDKRFPVVDVNYSHVACIMDAAALKACPETFDCTFFIRGRGKSKQAACRAKVHSISPLPGDRTRVRAVLGYEPVSGLNRYLVDYYLLKDSLI